MSNTNESVLPFLVAVEGLDGSGKTTVIPQVAAALRSEGWVVIEKPEFPPGVLTVEFQEALARGLFLGEHLAMPPSAAFFYLLYAEALSIAALLEAINEERGASSGRPRVILADRYIPTHALYQAYFASTPYGHASSVRILSALDTIFTELYLPRPELVLLLNAPSNVLCRRLEIRERRPVNAEEVQVLEHLRRAYQQIAASNVYPTAEIDASRPPHAVVADAVRVIRNHVLSRRQKGT